MAFAGISDLRILHLVHTGLMTMPPLDPVRSTLKELYLDFNNISFVPGGYFSGFKTLQILSIRHNILRLFPVITQLQLTISKLLLTNNILQSIPYGFNGTFIQNWHHSTWVKIALGRLIWTCWPPFLRWKHWICKIIELCSSPQVTRNIVSGTVRMGKWQSAFCISMETQFTVVAK